MNSDRKKAKRIVILFLAVCIGVALLCIGIAAYLVITYRGKVEADSGIIWATKILALTGLFFLILAFGYLLPILITHKKKDRKGE